MQVHFLCPAIKTSYLDRKSLKDYYTFYSFEDMTELSTEWTPDDQRKFEIHFRNGRQVQKISWYFATLDNYQRILSKVKYHEITDTSSAHVVFCPMDGNEFDGWPGVTVLEAVEKCSFAYTGANNTFYKMDAEKRLMKKAVSLKCPELTPKYFDLTDFKGTQEELERIVDGMNKPLIVKPNKSSGSEGLTQNSIVNNVADAIKIANELLQSHHGAYLEEFVSGTEYTCLITGDQQYGTRVYKAIERVFKDDLPTEKKFLFYDMKWSQTAGDPEAGCWWYDRAPELLQPKIQKTVSEVYNKIEGNGYARMDLRICSKTGNAYVIDVNANCSLDVTNTSSLYSIMKAEGSGYETLLNDLMKYALERSNHKNKSVT